MKLLLKYWRILRRLKPAHFLLNLANYGMLRKNRNLYASFGIRKSILGSIAHRDISIPANITPWLDRGNSTEELMNHEFFRSQSLEVQQQLLQWSKRGFMILKNFVKEETAEKINSELDDLINGDKVNFDYTNTRVMNAYRHSPTIQKVVKDEKLVNLLSFILGKRAMLFQTISFLKGSESKAHSDSIHMTTEPLGYLIAVWIALEDVKQGCGPLHYYPGSHQLPYIMSEDFETGNTAIAVGDNYYENYLEKIDSLIEQNCLKKEEFFAKKGDLLVWHANLLHGGSPVTDKTLSRRSLVAHYFADGVLCYHEITQRPAIVKESL